MGGAEGGGESGGGEGGVEGGDGEGGGGDAGGGGGESSNAGAGGGEGGSLRKATDKRRIPLAVSCKTDGGELTWFKSEGSSPLRDRIGAWR